LRKRCTSARQRARARLQTKAIGSIKGGQKYFTAVRQLQILSSS
jgi:hypothetical protein